MYNQRNIDSIKGFLTDHHQTLSVAESVTSGHLQAALSLADGATEFFQGGITAYNLGQKAKHLNVDPIHAEASNCVSEKVSEQMALNSLKLFSSDWAVATTGYAAPVPEMDIEKLFVIFCIAFRDEIMLTKTISAPDDKSLFETQVFYVNEILKEFSAILRSQKERSKKGRNGH
jgi:nicotinamide-nucleotide amidase